MRANTTPSQQEEPVILDVAGAALRPSYRDVLHALLGGLSEKEIAAGRRLSRHTIHEYVKAVYRHFGVSSRAQLLSRFIRVA